MRPLVAALVAIGLLGVAAGTYGTLHADLAALTVAEAARNAAVVLLAAVAALGAWRQRT